MLCEKTNTQLLLAVSEENQRPLESVPPSGRTENSEADRKARLAKRALERYYANRDAIRARRSELQIINRDRISVQNQKRYRAKMEALGFTVKTVRRPGETTPEIMHAQQKAAQERFRIKHRERLKHYRKAWVKQKMERLKQNDPEKHAEVIRKRAEYHLVYRTSNREKRRLYKADAQRKAKWNKIRNARYRANHPKPVWQTPEERLEKRRAAGRVNQKKWKVKNLERHKARRDSDPLYRIVINLRRRVYDFLTGSSKSAHTLELVGCTVEQLKVHLESQFTEGMTWQNYGRTGWHMDHRTPLVAFDMSNPEEQRRAFHYSNVQPMWWLDNIRKNSKLPDGLRLTVALRDNLSKSDNFPPTQNLLTTCVRRRKTV